MVIPLYVLSGADAASARFALGRPASRRLPRTTPHGAEAGRDPALEADPENPLLDGAGFFKLSDQGSQPLVLAAFEQLVWSLAV